MKTKAKLVLSILGVLGLTSVALVGFTNYTVKDVIKIPVENKLNYLAVYQSSLPLSQAGDISNGIITMSVGDERVLSVNGYDTVGNPVEVSPVWDINRTDSIEYLMQGSTQFSIKGLKPGTTDIMVKYGGLTIPFKVIVH
ncbi:MAG: hypothetical protein HY811_05070 [Planctomycetes bacterium]|nr:hypothetical protein [Planctomycetota bacterium]